MALVLPHGYVFGLEDANLLEVDSSPVEPLDYVFGLARPRVRGPFRRRMEMDR
jgi:hypothetical protein